MRKSFFFFSESSALQEIPQEMQTYYTYNRNITLDQALEFVKRLWILIIVLLLRSKLWFDILNGIILAFATCLNKCLFIFFYVNSMEINCVFIYFVSLAISRTKFVDSSSHVSVCPSWLLFSLDFRLSCFEMRNAILPSTNLT